MGGNLYPELVRILKNAGCTFVRRGKGSHEIWHSPLSNKKFSVPHNTHVVGTANKILKDAGLTERF